ncbi:hypothetical protein KIPB_013443, partial [Kipferlia bialata]|eukprot:g13443.t1
MHPVIPLQFTPVEDDVTDAYGRQKVPVGVGEGEMMMVSKDDTCMVTVEEEGGTLHLRCKWLGVKPDAFYSGIVKVGRKVYVPHGTACSFLNVRVPGQYRKIPFKEGITFRISALAINVPLPGDPSKVLIYARLSNEKHHQMVTFDTVANTLTEHPHSSGNFPPETRRDIEVPQMCDWAVVGNNIHLIHTDRMCEESAHSSFNMDTLKWHKHGPLPFEAYSPAVISAGQ